MIERLARIPGTARLPSESQARAALAGVRASLSGETASLRSLVAALLDRQERIVDAEEALESGGNRNAGRMHVTGDESASGVKTFAAGIVLSGENDPVYYGATIYFGGDLVFPESTQFVVEDSYSEFYGDCRAVPAKELVALREFVSSHRSLFSNESGLYNLIGALIDFREVYSSILQSIANYESRTGRKLADDWADVRAVLAGGPAGAGSTMSDDRVAEVRKRIVAAAESALVSRDGSDDSSVGRLYRLLLRLSLIEDAVGSDFPDFDLPFSSTSSTAALQTALGGGSQ